MSRLRIHNSLIPPALCGPILVTAGSKRPRFWATVWADILRAENSEGTRSKNLIALNVLYQSASEQLGYDGLDEIISNADFQAMESILGGFLAMLRNESIMRDVDRVPTWDTALRFVTTVFRHFGAGEAERTFEIEAWLHRLQTLYAQVSPPDPKKPSPIRALPASVLEDLYELFNPSSSRNPFRSTAQKWRNYLIFLVFLHLGLRRGELLILPADVIREGFDYDAGKTRLWITVQETPYEDDDPRQCPPSIKTEYSYRQLPISRELVAVVDAYLNGHRGKASHSFLVNSSQNKPLASQSLGHMFAKVSEGLSESSVKALLDQGKTFRADGKTINVTSHDLRHTAAVVRLAKYLKSGLDLDAAVDKLRV